MTRAALRKLSLALPPGWRIWPGPDGWLYAVGANIASHPGALMTLASRSGEALAQAIAAEVARQERCLMTPFERQAAA